MNYKKALEILEISPIELTIEIVKRKYRMMALLYHPDKNPADDAHERFQEIYTAYDFLIKYLKNENEDFEDDSDTDAENNSNDSNIFIYKEILIHFLRSVSENGNEMNTIFYNIIHKITEKCEEKSLEFIRTLNKELLIKVYDILYKYSNILRLSDDFLLKIQKVLEDRIKNDECIILNPTLEDLFEKNVYKLVIGEDTLLIPLWHHELIYEINGVDIYVKCIPILPDDYRVDSENNLIIDQKYNINELLEKDDIKIIICGNQYKIPIEELRIVKRQKLLLANIGIPRIITNDIYNISKLANIILDIHLF